MFQPTCYRSGVTPHLANLEERIRRHIIKSKPVILNHGVSFAGMKDLLALEYPGAAPSCRAQNRHAFCRGEVETSQVTFYNSKFINNPSNGCIAFSTLGCSGFIGFAFLPPGCVAYRDAPAPCPGLQKRRPLRGVKPPLVTCGLSDKPYTGYI
jgi:hypothetical protein